MITNSQPWDNLKFDMAGIDEVKRKFFGTLYNTYGFFALYANVDHFRYAEAEVAIEERPEIDRWDSVFTEFSDQGSDRSLRKIRTDQGRPGYSGFRYRKSVQLVCTFIPEKILGR